MSKSVYFPQIDQHVTLGARIGRGSFRRVYECDYKDTDGREYVVKMALTRRERTDWSLRIEHNDVEAKYHNKFEYDFFTALCASKDADMTKGLAKCIGLSKGCKYLLMEKASRICVEKDRIGQPILTDALTDLHGQNIGVSAFDGRAMAIDYASVGDHRERQLRELGLKL